MCLNTSRKDPFNNNNKKTHSVFPLFLSFRLRFGYFGCFFGPRDQPRGWIQTSGQAHVFKESKRTEMAGLRGPEKRTKAKLSSGPISLLWLSVVGLAQPDRMIDGFVKGSQGVP